MGLLTANLDYVGEFQFHTASWSSNDVHITMKALQKREDFQKALSGKTRLNVKRLAQAIVEPAGQPVGEHPGVGASFFECTCMAALADQIQKSVGRSVLDLQICPDMVFAATHGQPHRGYWEGGEAERGLLIGVVG